MPRNQGRKGRRLGPYSKDRRGFSCILYMTPEQQQDDQLGEAITALALRGEGPAWLDDPLPIARRGQVPGRVRS